MAFWSALRKSQWALAILGSAAGGLLTAAILSSTVRSWTLSALRAAFGPVVSWFATTIPVSRGQCVVWFLVGFSTYAAISMVRAVWQRAAELTSTTLSSEEQLVLRCFAARNGTIGDSDDLVRASGLSAVRAKYLLTRLSDRGLVEGNAFCWYLSDRGQHVVISNGWA